MSNISHSQTVSSGGKVYYPNAWVKAGIVLVILLAVFKESITSLIGVWSSRPGYSHGFLIPFISLYMVYFIRRELARIDIKPAMGTGLFVTAAACLVYLVGNVSSVALLLHASLLLAVTGSVIMLFGFAYLRKLAYPLLYLIFMIPVIDVFLTKLHWPSQVVSAKAAAAILELIHIPSVRDVNVIHLPNTSFEVARACSGVRFFVSILAMGIPLAYFTQKNTWQKILLILFGILIVIPINSIRVAMIGLWAYRGGEVLHGPMHMFQGLFVAVAGFAVLIMFAYILNRLTHQTGQKEAVHESVSDSGAAFSETKQFNKAWVIAVSIFLMTGAWSLVGEPKPVSLSHDSLRLPDAINAWKAEEPDYDLDLITAYRADREIVRSYRNDTDDIITVYIGYYERQIKDRELVGYRLDALYKNARRTVIRSTEGEREINETQYETKNARKLAYYWYDLNGKLTGDKMMAKIMTTADGILHRRTNGAIIIVSTDLNAPSGEEKIRQRTIEFLQQFLPSMPSLRSERERTDHV